MYTEHKFIFTLWALPAGVTVKSNDMKPWSQKFLQTFLSEQQQNNFLIGGRSMVKERNTVKAHARLEGNIFHLKQMWERRQY